MFFKLNALNKAIAKDDLAQVCDLLARYPDLAERQGARHSMSLALEKSHDLVALALSDAGCNLLRRNADGLTVLQEAVAHARHTLIAAWLERFPLLWNEVDRARLALVAVDCRDIVTLRFLVENSISDPLHPALSASEKPLLRAALCNNQEAIQYLRGIEKEKAAARAREAGVDMTGGGAARGRSAWHLVDDSTIIRVREHAGAGYRLTEVFNFAAGACISVQRNLETGQETAVVLDLTAPACAALAREAGEQLARAGGNALPPGTRSALVKKQPEA